MNSNPGREILKNVLKFGVNTEYKTDLITGMNFRQDGFTPLYIAAGKEHLKICELIINQVEDKNPAANCGNTPLHAATKNGNLEIFKLIRKFIEDMNPMNNDGETPLMLGAKNNHFEILKIPCKRK